MSGKMMKRDEIKQRVFNIFSSVLKVDLPKLNEYADQDSLEAWDSMNHLLLIIELESGFDVNIPIEDSIRLTKIKDIIDFIENEKN